MRILVTGGAGFIGSHYVRTMLAGGFPGYEDARVTVYDKLTYAGNLANLDPVKDSPGYAFVQGDICDPAKLAEVLPGHDAVINFAAESHVDRSIAGAAEFITSNAVGVQVLLDACRGGRHRAGRARVDRRGVRLDRRRRLDRAVPARPELPLRGGQGGRRPDRDRLRPHPRRQRLGHPVLQQLRAVPVPGEGHPAVRHQPARRQAGAALRRRPERARLDPRGRPLPGYPTGARAGGGGQGLQHQRRHRAVQPRAHRGHPRQARRVLGRRGAGRGPQGPRPPLLRSTTRCSARWATPR